MTKRIDEWIMISDVVYISESTYNDTDKDFKGVWDVERWDIPGWEEKRKSHMGKRTIMPPFALFGCTCLLVEGIGLNIVSDEEWQIIADSM